MGEVNGSPSEAGSGVAAGAAEVAAGALATGAGATVAGAAGATCGTAAIIAAMESASGPFLSLRLNSPCSRWK